VINPTQFKQAIQCWTQGVGVVTTNSQTHGLQGMTVSAFNCLTADFAQILCCLNIHAETVLGIDESQCFAMNFLTVNQEKTARQFAGGANMEERFSTNPWHIDVTGSPLLDDSLVSLDCKLVQKIHAGFHYIVIGEIQASEVREGQPLIYHQGRYHELHEKKFSLL
jgi:flavin reductase (DIM6/NTAB) family NADH-FMN oxidoreductase RutF